VHEKDGAVAVGHEGFPAGLAELHGLACAHPKVEDAFVTGGSARGLDRQGTVSHSYEPFRLRSAGSMVASSVSRSLLTSVAGANGFWMKLATLPNSPWPNNEWSV
jgi:hypothetical protein